MLVALLYDILLLSAFVAAFVWGGKTERAGASIMVVASFATILTFRSVDERFHLVNPQLVLIDACAFAGLAILACTTRRFWPIWASSLQLLSVFANFAQLLFRRTPELTFAMNEQIWAWPILILIIAMSLRKESRLQAEAISLRS